MRNPIKVAVAFIRGLYLNWLLKREANKFLDKIPLSERKNKLRSQSTGGWAYPGEEYEAWKTRGAADELARQSERSRRAAVLAEEYKAKVVKTLQNKK